MGLVYLILCIIYWACIVVFIIWTISKNLHGRLTDITKQCQDFQEQNKECD